LEQLAKKWAPCNAICRKRLESCGGREQSEPSLARSDMSLEGRLQLGLSRLRSEVGRMLLASPPGRRREDEERRRKKEEEERRRKKRGESTHPLFQEMRRPLGHSVSLPVGGRRKVEEERRVRGRHSLPAPSATVNQPSHLPPPSLPSKQKLQRTDAHSASTRPTRTFAFDDGQLSVNSSESEVSEHIYEEIKDQSSEEDEEESSIENESFMLSISLERRNNLKLYGCLDWDFKPVSH